MACLPSMKTSVVRLSQYAQLVLMFLPRG
jgi:hypothetical protein